MNVIVTSEAVLHGGPTGPVFGPPGVDHAFLTRYLDVFDEVVVVARRAPTPPPAGARRVDGPSVRVAGLPEYAGIAGFASSVRLLAAALRPVLSTPSALVLRIPSPVGSLAQAMTWGDGRPHGVEVVGDPWEVLAPGVVDAPARPVLRLLGLLENRRLCFRAVAAAYVTRAQLQARYPPGPGIPGAFVSDVSLPGDDLRARLRGARGPALRGGGRLLFVGSLSQRYKGLDTLVRAVDTLCRANGPGPVLRVVGDGVYRVEAEDRVRRLNLDGRVAFLGSLNRDRVLEEMAEADLLVLPSRTEGSPRVLLEAMSVGTPCVATAVGGIPELLPPQALVPSGDAVALAALVARVLASPALRTWLVERGDETVRDFSADAQSARRRAFLRAVESATSEWLDRRAGGPGTVP